MFLITIELSASGPFLAGTLDPPPGPVSATRPPDTCFNNGYRFVDCGNGTVKDTKTGLFWLKNANCFGSQNWANANILIAGLGQGQCGLTDGSLPGDWRLPTLSCATGTCQPIETGTGEFASIFNSVACNASPYVLNATGAACSAVAPGSPFSGYQPDSYWSSSTFANDPSLGWRVDLLLGNTGLNPKNDPHYVWPVRNKP